MDIEYTHKPVMLHESIDALQITENGIYIDGTLGRAGHSREILKRGGHLISIDKDIRAIEYAREKLSLFGERFKAVYGDFKDIGEILSGNDISSVDGMFFDLGVSSPQLDDASRGFSYMKDAFLDMRMDSGSALRAYDIVNGYSYEDLRRILYEYGEERYSPLIALNIIKLRETRPINTTLELAELISSAMPSKALREKQHPAKRTFQALRIEVNNELGSLKKMLAEAPDLLKKGGRIAIISFHSLEDRLVKRAFKARESGCTCPKNMPLCVCGFEQTLKIITRSPVTPSKGELENNPRARSAKLRIAERC